MKVLWLSNCPLLESPLKTTGGWIQPIAEGISGGGDVQLAVIAFADVRHIVRHDYHDTQQWLVPAKAKRGRSGLPSKTLVKQMGQIAADFDPDLVHVWGVENYWGLLTARKLIDYPALLEMQGLKGVCAQHYTADLDWRDLIKCIGLKEICKWSGVITDKKEFARWGKFEEEMIRGHRCIDVQSEWMSAHVSRVNPDCTQFRHELPMRPQFYAAASWAETESQRRSCGPRPSIFFSSASPTPYKGLHVALRALAHVKVQFPGVRMRVAGNLQQRGIRQSGYMRWVNNLCRELGLKDCVDWLGPLSADAIVQELHHCDVNVVCSVVESYCLALAEPLFLGVPCVATFNGGTAWLGGDGDNVLFAPPGDDAMCAHQIIRVLRDPALKARLSTNARAAGLERHDFKRIIQRQIAIYQGVYEKTR